MAICAAAAALALKSVPAFTKLQLQGSTNPNSNCKPAFAFYSINNNGNGSVCKIMNRMDRKDGGVVVGRREAMGLRGMRVNWATSAMATPNANPTDDEEDGKALQSAPLTFNVGRPAKEEGKEEVLTVSVRVARGEVCGFNAFINLPDAQSDTPITRPQFAGTFFNEPHRLPNNPFRHTLWRIGISDVIRELGLSEGGNVLVTIVPIPATLPAPIVVKAVSVQLESL